MCIIKYEIDKIKTEYGSTVKGHMVVLQHA